MTSRRARAVGTWATVALVATCVACGGGGSSGTGSSGDTGTPASMLGTWVGEYFHPTEGSRTLTLVIEEQTGTYFTGTWNSSSGVAGDLTGTAASSRADFVATYHVLSCTGQFQGGGPLSVEGGRPRFDFVWSGTDCGYVLTDVPGYVRQVAGPN